LNRQKKKGQIAEKKDADESTQENKTRELQKKGEKEEQMQTGCTESVSEVWFHVDP
jgi:hypothetical protein